MGESMEIGLYEDGCWGGLLGFKMGIVIAFFHKSGIVAEEIDALNMSVMAETAFGPK